MTWTVTSTGSFLSTVEYWPNKDRSKTSPFRALAAKTRKKYFGPDGKELSSHLLVRARVREHLEDLRRVLPNLVIDDQPSADYRFRAVVTRKKWDEYTLACNRLINYDSHVKEHTRDMQQPHLRQPMYSAMMSIWGTMAKLQPTRPYSGSYGYGSYGSKATGPKGTFADAKDREPLPLDLFSKDVQPNDKLQTALDSVSPKTSGQVQKDHANADYVLDLPTAARLFIERKKAELTAEELQGADDEAFELYTRLQEDYGVDVDIDSEQVLDIVDSLDVTVAGVLDQELMEAADAADYVEAGDRVGTSEAL